MIRGIPGVLLPMRSTLRWVMATAAVSAGAAHIPVIPPHLKEAPYMGVLFILLTIACIALAMAAITYDAPMVYLAAATIRGFHHRAAPAGVAHRVLRHCQSIAHRPW
jgi:hypothetical protein